MRGGGPAAALNASLAGSLMELGDSLFKGDAHAARFGTRGLLKGDASRIPELGEAGPHRLSRTPGSAIGTGRDALEAEDYENLAHRFRDLDCGCRIMTGGNGTMDAARKLSGECVKHGITVCGTPKTMGNELSVTDHSPGFPSAARYLASSVREVAMDVRGLPIHVAAIEALGREAGWVAAFSALAATGEIFGADMILLPETAFDEEKFLSRMEELHRRKGSVVVVASEGLRYADGKPIVAPVFQIGRSVCFGGVSSHLSQLITKKLGIKSRFEKPGILGRASIMCQSELDRTEAIRTGGVSVKRALGGRQGWMSIFRRLSTEPHRTATVATPILDEILRPRRMPEEFIDSGYFPVAMEFLKHARPLAGKNLGDFISFVQNPIGRKGAVENGQEGIFIPRREAFRMQNSLHGASWSSSGDSARGHSFGSSWIRQWRNFPGRKKYEETAHFCQFQEIRCTCGAWRSEQDFGHPDLGSHNREGGPSRAREVRFEEGRVCPVLS